MECEDSFCRVTVGAIASMGVRERRLALPTRAGSTPGAVAMALNLARNLASFSL